MGGKWPVHKTSALQADGCLLVEDGNHGEYRPRRDEFVDAGVAFIRAADMSAGRVLFESASKINGAAIERIRKGIGEPGDVLLSHKGTVGKVAFVPEGSPAFVCSPQTTFWRSLCPERIDRRYLYFFLHSAYFQDQLRSCKGETDMADYVSLTNQRNLRVVLPPIATQRAIAHILGTLDDKIELNRRMNETLEGTARALFKSWFVDFDPVRAKADGRPPAGLDPQTAALFPDGFEDSELGKIPKGWRVCALEDVAHLNPETWKKSTRPEVIRYVDLSNTKWGHIEEVTVYAEGDAPSRAQRVLRPGDSIVGTVRPGNGSYAFIAENGLTGSTGFAVLRPIDARHGEFVYLAATNRENIDRLSHLADGAAYPAVRPDVVANTEVVLPVSDIFASFSKTARPLLAGIAENERQSQTLAQLRDTLLPRLLSGELEIPDAEKFLEAAL